jgi:hypothetical protein
MESQILALKKVIGISNTNWYFKYQLVLQIPIYQEQQEQEQQEQEQQEQQEQQSGYKSSASTTRARG